jgi:hypothetical protein
MGAVSEAVGRGTLGWLLGPEWRPASWAWGGPSLRPREPSTAPAWAPARERGQGGKGAGERGQVWRERMALPR